MNPWPRALGLFHEIAAFDAALVARRQSSERAWLDLDDWYVRSEELLLVALRSELEQRGRELGSLGIAIRVTGPSVPRLLGPGELSLRFLSVHFEAEVVTAYSIRQPGSSLVLHWAWQLKTPRGRFPRILSVPGIRVRRGPEQEMLLEAVGGRSGAGVGLSDIAAEILAMLAEAAASRRRLSSGIGSARWAAS